MKLSLPSLPGRNKPADKQPAAKPMPQLTGKVQQTSLRRLQLQLLVAGVALLAGLAFFIYDENCRCNRAGHKIYHHENIKKN